MFDFVIKKTDLLENYDGKIPEKEFHEMCLNMDNTKLYFEEHPIKTRKMLDFIIHNGNYLDKFKKRSDEYEEKDEKDKDPILELVTRVIQIEFRKLEKYIIYIREDRKYSGLGCYYYLYRAKE